jgi:hypothetical protein
MELGTPLLAVGAGERAASFDLFSETLKPEWIAHALTATGTTTIRRRKLPAGYVMWIVIGMGLLRDRSIREVVRHLGSRSTDRPFFGHAGRARRADSRKWAPCPSDARGAKALAKHQSRPSYLASRRLHVTRRVAAGLSRAPAWSRLS